MPLSFTGTFLSGKGYIMRLSSSSPSSLPLQKSSSLPQSEKSAQTVLKERQGMRKLKRAIQHNLSGYLFLLPALAVFALFVWYPIVLGFTMSFQNVDLINPSVWVGLKNYQRVIADPLFSVVWRNTLAFTLYALLFGYL